MRRRAGMSAGAFSFNPGLALVRQTRIGFVMN